MVNDGMFFFPFQINENRSLHNEGTKLMIIIAAFGTYINLRHDSESFCMDSMAHLTYS